MIHLKREIFSFESRDFDWWCFTLLPVLIFIPISIFVFVKYSNLISVLLLITGQLLSYSTVLSSTDLGLRSKSNENKNHQIGRPFLLIIFLFGALLNLYLNLDSISESFQYVSFYLIFATITTYISIYLYNHNPDSSDFGLAKIAGAKKKSEDMAEKAFKSPKSESKIKDVKWGQ
jgi:hypothetical protein